MFRRRGRKPKTTPAKRFMRTIVSVVILTAFVLGISLFVKEMANFDPYRAVRLTGPIWEKVGLSQELVGDVAGAFAERIFKTNIAPSENYQKDNDTKLADGDISMPTEGDILTGESSFKPSAAGDVSGATTVRDAQEIQFKVVLMADSQNDNVRLKTALEKAKSLGAHSVFFLGDYTAWGSVEELQEAKKVMDEAGMIYYSLPGDHDLGQSVGPANYNVVFSDKQERIITIKDKKFVLLDNSANKTLIDELTVRDFRQELRGADYVLLSQPLYHYAGPSIIKPLMGYLLVDGELKKTDGVFEQAEGLLAEIRQSKVRSIISGDHHSFDISQDPVRGDLMHVTVGPVTKEMAYQGITSVTLLNIYNDGTYSVQEVPF